MSANQGQIVYLSPIAPDGCPKLFQDEPDILAVSDVARLLGVVPATVRREIKRGSLESIRVGTCVRVTKSALLRYVGEVQE